MLKYLFGIMLATLISFYIKISTMKSILAVLLVFSSLYVSAQRNKLDEDHENFFKFGVKGGVNVNKVTGQSYKSGFNYNFQAGAFVQINFSRKLGIQPEVNFVQTSTEFTSDANDVYNDIFRDGSQKNAALNYLEIPVFLNVNVGTSKRVKLQIGPAYGGLLKQTVDSLKANGNIYKNGEWSAIGGLWIQLPLVNLGARYKLGLSDINAIDNRQTWRNQAIQIFVGLTF
jgi:hypothetical protein